MLQKLHGVFVWGFRLLVAHQAHQKKPSMRSAPVHKVLELRAEVALQFGGRVLGDEEQHTHWVEVGVGGGAGGHLSE